ncbi:hypothetical protein [Croceicoccus bisphenolivorans]|uniref:hypothetical protein n=1 Tax=Croceicoccus bisphenolivorans TaxID=1783232 RepID=UPI0008338AD5|nr:hypothetical protein [Croceicoccus bisphenolivorans]
MTEADVIEAKRLRRAARTVFETQRDLVKADLGAASLGKRVANRIAEDGRFIADEAADAASRHKVVLSAGALALTGWFLRKPIMAFAASIVGADVADEEATEPDTNDAGVVEEA